LIALSFSSITTFVQFSSGDTTVVSSIAVFDQVWGYSSIPENVDYCNVEGYRKHLVTAIRAI